MNLGIDMGGTHTGIGLVEGLTIKGKLEFDTEIADGVTAYVKRLKEKVDCLLKENNLTLSDIDSIGIGVPGSANQETGMVEYANNIGFENVPFRDMLSEAFSKPVVVDNDANLAAFGEYLLSGSKSESFMMVTLGTGIGGGIILGGKIYRGINFAEGEIGHMTLKYDGIDCNCGRKGCFEAYASTNALVKMACDAMVGNPGSLIWQASKINGETFFETVKKGDSTMLAVLDEYTTLLSEGISNIINILQPEELVIGGGISNAAEMFLPMTIEKVNERIYSRASKKNTLIRAAMFKNDAGIVGAASL